MAVAAETLRALVRGSVHDLCVPGHEPALSPPGRPAEGKAAPCRRLFKLLLQGSCRFDCAYCTLRNSRRDLSLTPEEAAGLFLGMQARGEADGFFLSSGVGEDTDRVMHDLVETGEILRRRGYTGYLHLKILPGAARADIADAARVADRISINLEVPSAGRMSEVAQVKDYRSDLLTRLSWIREARPFGHTSQMVLGAAGETDREVYRRIAWLYGRMQVSRVYYVPFRPLAGTPMESYPPAPVWRAWRWYQLDTLVRTYRLGPADLETLFDGGGMLTNRDPKEVLAEQHGPVDLLTAHRTDLLRVPGIGPRTAEKLVAARIRGGIRDLRDCAACGVNLRRAGPHLALGGRSPAQRPLSDFVR
ncbi:MAG: radical SAM protein [Methanomicrobiales archaeon]|nr:radical SAM protein [Methanomicrobiales archaeon]